MKIVIGSDHRGYKLKEYLKNNLSLNYKIDDVGSFSEDSVDYPDIAINLAEKLQNDLINTLGIIICGSGNGVCIAVNKFSFIRGSLIYNADVAMSAKKHNNANVLCLSADNTSNEDALKYINIFVLILSRLTLKAF
jgi:ribose 5-phosphate isomerase B